MNEANTASRDAGAGPEALSAFTTFLAERSRFADATKRGVGMPAAGMLYWISVAVLVRTLPIETALVFAFVATGAVFPVGAALTRLMGGDLFAKSPTLAPLGIQLAALQLFYWPIIIVVFKQAPEWTPFAMAVLFGSHFLPYSWIYASRAYALLSVSVAVVLSVAALVTQDALYRTAPIAAAACYAVAVGMLLREMASSRQVAAASFQPPATRQ